MTNNLETLELPFGTLTKFEKQFKESGVICIDDDEMTQDGEMIKLMLRTKEELGKSISSTFKNEAYITSFPHHCGTKIISMATSKLALELAEHIISDDSVGFIQYMNNVEMDAYGYDLDAERRKWLRELGYRMVAKGTNPNTENKFKLFVKVINQDV